MINEQEVLREVMLEIASGEPMKRVLPKAVKAKLALSKAWGEAQQALSLLDTMVRTFIPTVDWPLGWVAQDWQVAPAKTVQATQITQTIMVPRAPRLAPTTSKGVILDIAARMIADGNTTVTSKSIAERLQAQGDQRLPKHIGTAVGNVLIKSGKWRKVASGAYEAIEQGEVK